MAQEITQEILNNVSHYSLDKLVTWILKNIEFDTIIECINKKVYNKEIFDQGTLTPRIIEKKEYEPRYECPDWYFSPDTYEDIVLWLIEKTKNKLFAPIRVKGNPTSKDKVGVNFEIECIYHTGETFTISYHILKHLIEYIHDIPDHQGPQLVPDITITNDTVPILIGSLWSQSPTILKRDGTYYNSKSFWATLEKNASRLSTPRLVQISSKGKIIPGNTSTTDQKREWERRKKDNPDQKNVKGPSVFLPNSLHKPGQYGLGNLDNQVPIKLIAPINEKILLCQKRAIPKQLMLTAGFGNIQNMAAEKDIYISHYSFGAQKYHIYNFNKDWERDPKGRLKGKWITRNQLGQMIRSKKQNRISEKGLSNFKSAFGQCSKAIYRPLGQDLQARPVSPHRFGYYSRAKKGSFGRKKKSCFGRANNYGPIKSAWSGATHGGFPRVKYGYKGTQSTYGGSAGQSPRNATWGGITGLVGAPSNQKYILNY